MQINTLILGAGAAGLMCAAQVPGALVVDHAKAAGEKIRISGGGRCNFTNIYASPENYLSGNPHFVKSALSRYTQWDFLDMVNAHGIAYHEKTLGQLFCDHSAKDIISMLHREIDRAGSQVWVNTSIKDLRKTDSGFDVDLDRQGRRITVACQNLVVATGGKSIPKMGATGIAYDIAAQFGLRVTETRAALVPFTFSDGRFAEISGVATPVRAYADGPSFDEAMLFTHRGLSGPAMLQISSYWHEGQDIIIDLDPSGTLLDALRDKRQTAGRHNIATELSALLPARLVGHIADDLGLSGNLADWSDARLTDLVTRLRAWHLRPSGTEGYRTAEVTVGGINTDDLSSKTMAAKSVPGLYFIGEAVDVTGWLGGYNFQWAWSSGWAAAQAITAG
jgi:predicted Rossmann fold flavoprotein